MGLREGKERKEKEGKGKDQGDKENDELDRRSLLGRRMVI